MFTLIKPLIMHFLVEQERLKAKSVSSQTHFNQIKLLRCLTSLDSRDRVIQSSSW